MITPAYSRADVIARLREIEAEIRGFGVRRLSLFGSFARDEPRPDSDVDLLVQFAPGQKSLARFDGSTTCWKSGSPAGWSWSRPRR